MWRVVRAAHPVRGRWGDDDVRLSDVVTVPATFGSTILLRFAASANPETTSTPRGLVTVQSHGRSVCSMAGGSGPLRPARPIEETLRA
jgi:hypothetical protein